MALALTARPTTYEGVPMRSRMEARVAAYLDSIGVRWEYEPRAFASRAGQYLPDFRWEWGDGETVYLEVKGPDPSDSEWPALLDRMAIIWNSEPDAVLALITDATLSRGLFGFWWPGMDDFEPVRVVRCPDHERVVCWRHVSEGSLTPWCGVCDPDQSLSVTIREARAYLVTG